MVNYWLDPFLGLFLRKSSVMTFGGRGPEEWYWDGWYCFLPYRSSESLDFLCFLAVFISFRASTVGGGGGGGRGCEGGSEGGFTPDFPFRCCVCGCDGVGVGDCCCLCLNIAGIPLDVLFTNDPDFGCSSCCILLLILLLLFEDRSCWWFWLLLFEATPIFVIIGAVAAPTVVSGVGGKILTIGKWEDDDRGWNLLIGVTDLLLLLLLICLLDWITILSRFSAIFFFRPHTIATELLFFSHALTSGLGLNISYCSISVLPCLPLLMVLLGLPSSTHISGKVTDGIIDADSGCFSRRFLFFLLFFLDLKKFPLEVFSCWIFSVFGIAGCGDDNFELSEKRDAGSCFIVVLLFDYKFKAIE